MEANHGILPLNSHLALARAKNRTCSTPKIIPDTHPPAADIVRFLSGMCVVDRATRRSTMYHVSSTRPTHAPLACRPCGHSTRRRWEQISRCRFTCRIKPCMKLWPLIPGPTFPSLVHERLGRGELAAVAVAGCTRARVAANTGYLLSMTVVTLLRCAGSCLCNRRWETHARKKRDEGSARMWRHEAVPFLRCRPNSVMAGSAIVPIMRSARDRDAPR